MLFFMPGNDDKKTLKRELSGTQNPADDYARQDPNPTALVMIKSAKCDQGRSGMKYGNKGTRTYEGQWTLMEVPAARWSPYGANAL